MIETITCINSSSHRRHITNLHMIYGTHQIQSMINIYRAHDLTDFPKDEAVQTCIKHMSQARNSCIYGSPRDETISQDDTEHGPMPDQLEMTKAIACLYRSRHRRDVQNTWHQRGLEK